MRLSHLNACSGDVIGTRTWLVGPESRKEVNLVADFLHKKEGKQELGV